MWLKKKKPKTQPTLHFPRQWVIWEGTEWNPITLSIAVESGYFFRKNYCFLQIWSLGALYLHCIRELCHRYINKPLPTCILQVGLVELFVWEAMPSEIITCDSVLLPCRLSQARVCFLCPQCFSRCGMSLQEALRPLFVSASGYLSEWYTSDS